MSPHSRPGHHEGSLRHWIAAVKHPRPLRTRRTGSKKWPAYLILRPAIQIHLNRHWVKATSVLKIGAATPQVAYSTIAKRGALATPSSQWMLLHNPRNAWKTEQTIHLWFLCETGNICGKQINVPNPAVKRLAWLSILRNFKTLTKRWDSMENFTRGVALRWRRFRHWLGTNGAIRRGGEEDGLWVTE